MTDVILHDGRNNTIRRSSWSALGDAVRVGQLSALLRELLIVDGKFRLETVDKRPLGHFLDRPLPIVPMNEFSLPYSIFVFITNESYATESISSQTYSINRNHY